MKNTFCLLLIFSCWISAQARASDVDYKVLGRGFEDRKTGQILQMACVGESTDLIQEERTCDRVQFIIYDEKNKPEVIGPVFTLNDDQKIKKQLSTQFKAQGLKKDAHNSRVYHVFQRTVYGEKSRPGSGYVKNDFTESLWGFAVIGGTAVLTMGFGWAFLPAFAVTFMSPIILDFALLPISILIDFSGLDSLEQVGDSTVKSLQDRAKPYWQFRAKSISSHKFQKFLEKLKLTDTDKRSN